MQTMQVAMHTHIQSQYMFANCSITQRAAVIMHHISNTQISKSWLCPSKISVSKLVTYIVVAARNLV